MFSIPFIGQAPNTAFMSTSKLSALSSRALLLLSAFLLLSQNVFRFGEHHLRHCPIPAIFAESDGLSNRRIQDSATDVLTGLQTIPIAYVEATLTRQYLKRCTNYSALAHLCDLAHGTSPTVATDIAKELAERVGDVSTVPSLVAPRTNH